MKSVKFIIAGFAVIVFSSLSARELYKVAKSTTHTRWINHENPKGEKGKGGMKFNIAQVPAPLFRDPVFDGAADPTVIWNDKTKEWLNFYTAEGLHLN